MNPHRILPHCLALVAVCLGGDGALAGQVRVERLDIRAGVSGEAYFGDFASLLVPQLDSTESALAGVGEWSARGSIRLVEREDRTLTLGFDGGIRQFTTSGFQSRNYAPREHTGWIALRYAQFVSGGGVFGEARVRMRGLVDSPPMPLYLQPGHDKYDASVGYTSTVRRDLHLGIRLSGERADFAAPTGLPALDLLDRSSVLLRASATRIWRPLQEGSNHESDSSSLVVYATYGHHSYPGQGLGVLRSDQALGLGMTYGLRSGRLDLTVGGEGLVSRSNSPRVEYNYARITTDVGWVFGANTWANVSGILAIKRHVRPGQDALVPGEEADNGSVLSATLTRWLGPDITGSLQVGWRDVETNFSGAHYTRMGVSFSLVYWLR